MKARGRPSRIRVALIEDDSGLFDGEWYLDHNADVRALGGNPLDHFISHGAAEGRDPGPSFSTALYLIDNPDVQDSGLNPLAHYILHGRNEGRRIFCSAQMLREMGIFDSQWYRTSYLDVAAAGSDPLMHFILYGASERRDPSATFSVESYLTQHPDLRGATSYVLADHIARNSRALSDGGRESSYLRYPHEDLSVNGASAVSRYLNNSSTQFERLARPDVDIYSPKISLIIPIYNTPPIFLYELLQSIFSQTYSNWEISAVDDGSFRVDTLAVIDGFRSDSRIKMQRLTENSGIAKASHAALLAATGDYVGFIDHDDILAPTALSEVVSLLRESPEIDYVYTDHAQADANGLPFSLHRKPSWSPEFLLATNYIVHFKVVRRDLLMKLGGIEKERANVQDLGMSLRLVRGGAKIRHLPKALYYWREHVGSVAASSAAKPGIEGLLVETYNEHSRSAEAAVEHFWPKNYQPSREGVFAMSFPEEHTPTALIAWIHPASKIDPEAVRERMEPLLERHVTLHVVAFGTNASSRKAALLSSDAAIGAYISQLDDPYVVFVSATARTIGIDGLSNLTGYLSMDSEIGAVGGKILDDYLRVKDGGFLMTEAGAYGLICGGQFDNNIGYWYNNQITSNVDAVSARCMAVRRDQLAACGGFKIHEFGELAGSALSLELRRRKSRIVYSPRFKLHDSQPISIHPSADRKLREMVLPQVDQRMYKSIATQ